MSSAARACPRASSPTRIPCSSTGTGTGRRPQSARSSRAPRERGYSTAISPNPRACSTRASRASACATPVTTMMAPGSSAARGCARPSPRVRCAARCAPNSRAGSRAPAGCAPTRATSSWSPGWRRRSPCWPGCCRPRIGRDRGRGPRLARGPRRPGLLGPAAVPVPVDEHGMRVGELALGQARAALLTPAHQFPTGVVLAPQRRATCGLGRRGRRPDRRGRLRRGVPLRPGAGPRVARLGPRAGRLRGSTSKTLAPGMRLGWLIPPVRLRPELTEAKYHSDLGSPALRSSCWPADRQRRARAAHSAGSAAAEQAGCPAPGAARAPAAGPGAGRRGGAHLLITFPGLDGSDADLTEAILRTGVLVQPLSWHRQRPGVPGFVWAMPRTPGPVARGGAADSAGMS